MAQLINTNVSSLNAQRNLTSSQGSLSTSLQRLSSGLRINSAKDDAAGLAISERMTAQIRGLNQAARNANDAISLSQTAEGALGAVGENLQRIRELAVQASNATNSSSDRAALQQEASQLISEITRVGSQTQFNGLNLLDGSFSNQNFQVGANNGQTITLGSIQDARAASLGRHSMTTAGTIAGTVVVGAAGTNGVTAAVAGTNFTITNSNGTTSPITYAANAGADAIASAINTSAAAIGVTATASNSTTLSGLSAAGTVSFTLNGQAVSASVTNQNDLSSLVSAINGVAGTTGVTASFTSTSAKNSITLTTTDGRNIGLSTFNNTAGGAGDTISFGGSTLTDGAAATDTAVKTGTVSLTSTGGAFSTANASAQLFTAATTNSSFASVAAIDLTNNAAGALDTLDSALAQINSSRASLGAIQNRFNSTVSNLNTNSENLSASRSRIQDADFAAETANLSRAQILQQAGTAMLAQANSLPQGVLSLLRG